MQQVTDVDLAGMVRATERILEITRKDWSVK